MHQIRFRLGLCPRVPDPAMAAYSAPSDPLAGFKGPTSKGREGKGGKGVRERRGMGGKEKEGRWEGGGRGRDGKGERM